MRIALGLITRNFDDPELVLRFLANARKYGHTIERVIIAYSHNRDDSAIEAVEKECRLDLLSITDSSQPLRQQMRLLGVPSESISGLLEIPDGGKEFEVPYGAYRNRVLFKALLEGIDYLLFFDTDVKPQVLTHLEGAEARWQEIDFVGTHLLSLSKPDVSATTSEYSGYYIIPPMSFPGIGDLLTGLGKGMALDYMEDCHEHQCLNLGPVSPGSPRLTDKPLGGNLGISLRKARRLAPFFSTIYSFSGLIIKGRGEDTLLGQAISASKGRIIDIDLHIFHDTYEGFPDVPDVRKESIRDRFYWACLGWIGRNPFLSWYLGKAGHLETDWRSELALQRIGLEVGGEKAAEYLHDPRFRDLAAAFEAAFAELPGTINRYHRLMEGWRALLLAIRKDQPPNERHEVDVNDLERAS